MSNASLKARPAHPLLGDRQPQPQPVWFGQLDARLLPWLNDHRLTGSAVVPAAAYLEMAAAAVREFLGEATVFLEGIRFHHLLFLPEEKSVPSCVRLDPAMSSFQIFTLRPDTADEWELQAEGIYRPGRLHAPRPHDLDAIRAACPTGHDPATLYQQLDGIGQIYGPTFRGLHSLRLRKDEAVLAGIRSTAVGDNDASSTKAASSSSPALSAASEYLLYPPALDSCFHSSFALRRGQDRRAVIIMSLRQLQIFAPLPAEFFTHLRLVQHWKNSHLGDLTLLDPAGAVLAEMKGLKLLAVESAASKPGQRERKFYGFVWEPQPQPPLTTAAREPAIVAAADAGPVLIFADREGFGESLAESLRAGGAAPTLVFRAADRNGTSLAVDLRQPDWAVDLWQTLAARGPLPARVLYLWNWDNEEADGCAAFLALTQARLAQPGGELPARWLVATRRAQAVHETDDLHPAPAAIWGFARSVQTEQPQWRLSLVDCADASCGDVLLREFFVAEIEPEVSLRRDSRHVRRLRPMQAALSEGVAPPPAYALNIEGAAGRLDALQFRGRARRPPGAGEVEIEIAAAGLNFRDLMKALGIYPLREDEAAGLGDEFAGRVARVGRGVRKWRVGDRVMGFTPAGGAFSSHLVLAADALWKIPARLSFAEAASIPVVFGTAFHALHTLARLRRGETVLIHAAAGGVGLAALQLAQQIGATVFATAGSDEKRDYAALARRRARAGLPHARFRRRNPAPHRRPRRGCRAQFAGRRVPTKEPRRLRAARPLRGNRQARPLRKQRAAARRVSAVARVFRVRSQHGARTRGTRTAARCAGFSRAVSITATTATSRRSRARRFRPATPSLRFAACRLRSTSASSCSNSTPRQVPEVPPEFWPHAGRHVSGHRRLERLRPRHRAMAGRARRPAPRAAQPTRRCRAAEDAPTHRGDARRRRLGERRLRPTSRMRSRSPRCCAGCRKSAPPLRGVFHSAMVLRDRFLADMTQDDLAAVLAPKIDRRHGICTTRRATCRSIASSSTRRSPSVIGAPGHANYAAANAFLDALAHAPPRRRTARR